MSKLLLIDGYGIVFRAYYSHLHLSTSNNIPTGALYGFLNIMLKILSNREFDKIAIIFDSGVKNFRHDIYSEYKANRAIAPSDLISQLMFVDDAAKILSVPSLKVIGFEADDIIASIARKAYSEGFIVEIISSDKDLMQLVNDKIYLFDPSKDKIFMCKDVEEKFGVSPKMLTDLLALTGDASDNIPGVYGIGPKTAAKLINQFGSIDSIIANADKISNIKQRESIVNSVDKILISRELVNLCFDVPIDVNIDELYMGKPDIKLINDFLLKYEFKTLIPRFEKIFCCEIASKNINNVVEFKLIDIIENIKKLVIQIIDHGFCVVDFFFLDSDISGIALFCEFYYYIPISNNGIDIESVIRILSEVFVAADIVKISYSIRNIISFLKKYNICVNSYYDIETMFYSVKSYIKDVSINYIASLFDVNIVASISCDDINDELQIFLNNFVLFFDVYTNLKEMIWKKSVCYVNELIDNPLIAVLSEMSNDGVMIDIDYLKELMNEFDKEIRELEYEIYKIANVEFNIHSPKQINEVLFDRMGIPHKLKNKKSGMYSTNIDVLDGLNDDGVEIAGKILRWRHLYKLVNTYIMSLIEKVDINNRIHTTYLINTTITGRLSSVNPNLQNIPIKTDDGRKIRKAFIAKNDCFIVSADYSQIELKILAHYANIDSLINAFNKKIDVHNITAASIFDVDPKDVDYEMRRKAKIINFGIMYGISAFGIKKQLGCSQKEAEKYIEDYFTKYSGIKKYIEDIKNEARVNGFVKTIYGRYCFLPNINSGNFTVRSYSERTAVNAPIQGSAADIMKIAMKKVFNELIKRKMKSKIIMQIHDELVVECNKNELHEVCDILKLCMTSEFSLSIPLDIDINYGTNWLNVEPFLF